MTQLPIITHRFAKITLHSNQNLLGNRTKNEKVVVKIMIHHFVQIPQIIILIVFIGSKTNHIICTWKGVKN